MTKLTAFTGLVFCLLLMTACAADDEPAASCTEAGIYEIPASSIVVTTAIENDTDNGTYWVCNGGSLTLSGSFNRVLVDAGGLLTINGNENIAYVLGNAEIVINGDDQTVWLNGESKTTVYGANNFLYYYKTGVLLEYGSITKVEDLCGNVELDYSTAPEQGCQ